VQQPPHRRRRQPHPADALGHLRHPVQGPQVIVEPVGRGAIKQRLLDLPHLLIGQLGRPAARLAAAQGLDPALPPPGPPASGGFVADPDQLGDLGGPAALGEQLGGAQPAGLAGVRAGQGLGLGRGGAGHHLPPAAGEGTILGSDALILPIPDPHLPSNL
jgi:hypothetical protein